MFKNNSFLAFIPARGGSKGILNKNLYPIQGLPLITYTLQEVKQSKHLDRIIVSTDNEKIAEVSHFESIEVLRRPPELATDKTKIIDVMLHAISVIDEEYEFIVLLQPTSPLRKANHIDEAIEFFVNSSCAPLTSVSPVQNHPLFIRSINSVGQLKNLVNKPSTVCRQDLPAYFYVNGAIYINKISELNPDTSLNDNPLGYIIPSISSLDIDEPYDIKLMEMLLDYNQSV